MDFASLKTAKMQDNNLISTATAAKLLQLTPRRIQMLADEGHFQRLSRGRWNLVDITQGYIKFLQRRVERADQTGAKARLADSKAEMIERRLAREDEHIILLKEALECHDYLSNEFLASLDELPEKVARNPAELGWLKPVFQRGRKRLAQEFKKLRYELETGKSDDGDTDDES